MRPWQSASKILCIRPDNMGDVIMTQPAFRALSSSFPKASLTLLTSRLGAQITEYIPELDDVIVADLPFVKTEKEATPTDLLSITELIKLYDFDAAIIFTNFSQSPLPAAMLSFLAGIQRRAAFVRENPYNLLTDWVVDTEPFTSIQHGVRRQLSLVAQLGATTADERIRLTVHDEDKETVSHLITTLGVQREYPWIVVHPGVSEIKRQYPIDLLAKALRELIDTLHVQILLTGAGQKERELCNYLSQQLGEKAFTLAERLSIGELLALLSLAPLLISNNTGPVHMASGVKTPVVVLYAKTNPEHTPWMVPSRVLYFDIPQTMKSRNALLAFLPQDETPATISPYHIVQAARELLAQRAQPSATYYGT